MRQILKRRFWFFLAAAFVILGILGGVYFGLRWVARHRDPGPAVAVEEVDPAGPALVGQSVIVRGQAHHPDGLLRTELWVNGEKISTQPLEDPTASVPIHAAWQPDGEGTFSVVLKAASIHGVTASSSPRLIRAEAQSDVVDPDARTQIIFREGDTLESAAEELGVEPSEIELPEGTSEPEPGDSGFVRDRDLGEGVAEEGERLEEEDIGRDLPRIEPLEPMEDPVPTGGGSDDVPFWVNLPGVDLVCAALPEACGGGPEDGLPERPDNVLAYALSDRCEVAVDWVDRSDNETGFRIYRVEPGVTTGLEFVGEVPFSPGTGNHRSFLDEFAGRGRFTYLVQAYNGAGDVYMPAGGEVETRCDDTYAGSKIPLLVEMVSLDLDTSREQLYCYVSLGEGPFSKIPRAYGEFIEKGEDGSWNIADYFAGEKGKRLLMPRESDLKIRGQCNVREGFRPLPRFSVSIPPEHWDGREIIVGPEDGSYQAAIRVFLSTEASGDKALVDPDIPPPYNLKEADHWQRCLFGRACLTINQPAVAWEYPTSWGVGEPRAYRVFRTLPGESEVEEVHRSGHPSRSAPAALGSSQCRLGASYSVNAVTDIRDPITGEPIESPPSEEFVVRSECVEIEVTLHDLVINKIRDNCPGLRCSHDGQVYGKLWIGGKEIIWNFHSHSDGTISGDIPSTTHVNEETIPWSDFYLNHGDGFDQNNHSFRIHVPVNEGFQINWEFKEHDRRGGDDNWCARRDRGTLFRLSREGWEEVWGGINIIEGDKGDCEVHIQVKAGNE
jgi:hypothetical protein